VISVVSVVVTTALVLFLLLKDDLLDEPVDERPVVGWGAADVYYGKVIISKQLSLQHLRSQTGNKSKKRTWNEKKVIENGEQIGEGVRVRQPHLYQPEHLVHA
jgi:hypothetical protein